MGKTQFVVGFQASGYGLALDVGSEWIKLSEEKAVEISLGIVWPAEHHIATSVIDSRTAVYAWCRSVFLVEDEDFGSSLRLYDSLL